MAPEQTKQLEQLNKMHEKLSNATFDYWNHYSNMGTWQFWFMTGLLLLPLLVLYLFIDRRRAFLLGFFGFNVHLWMHYIDNLGVARGWWSYPYKIVPFFSGSIALDMSLIPISYMLLYQWTINHKMNFYVYGTGLSLFFSFLFKPALFAYDMFRMYKGMNYFYLFLLYMLIMLLSKWLTSLFLHFQNEPQPLTERTFKWNWFIPGREKAK